MVQTAVFESVYGHRPECLKCGRLINEHSLVPGSSVYTCPSPSKQSVKVGIDIDCKRLLAKATELGSAFKEFNDAASNLVGVGIEFPVQGRLRNGTIVELRYDSVFETILVLVQDTKGNQYLAKMTDLVFSTGD